MSESSLGLAETGDELESDDAAGQADTGAAQVQILRRAGEMSLLLQTCLLFRLQLAYSESLCQCVCFLSSAARRCQVDLANL